MALPAWALDRSSRTAVLAWVGGLVFLLLAAAFPLVAGSPALAFLLFAVGLLAAGLVRSACPRVWHRRLGAAFAVAGVLALFVAGWVAASAASLAWLPASVAAASAPFLLGVAGLVDGEPPVGAGQAGDGEPEA